MDFQLKFNIHPIGISLLFITIFVMIIGGHSVQAQDSSKVSQKEVKQNKNRAPYVFLDCSFCDYNHIRSEIDFVNYVRDPAQADIHIFITQTGLTSGGTEYELSFIGLKQFSRINFDLKHTATYNDTWAETRDELNSVIKSALIPFISQTPLASTIALDVDLLTSDSGYEEEIDDPWNYWVFEAYLGSVSLNLESNRTDFDSRWGIYADRVTDKWKLRFRPYFNYTFVEVEKKDGSKYTSDVERHGIDSYAIKSLGQHWSAGLFATYLTRNDRNIKNQVQVNPGVEYSILPYELATRKAITLQYKIGYTYADYYEETIFGVRQQNLLNHELRGAVDLEQPWGSYSAGLIGSHYFHDTDLRRIEVFSNFSIRLIEGLSLSLNGNFQMIQDQLTLPKGEASLEDVLLERRELATDFEFSGSVAITYTFGSEFSNVVNTRF